MFTFYIIIVFALHEAPVNEQLPLYMQTDLCLTIVLKTLHFAIIYRIYDMYLFVQCKYFFVNANIHVFPCACVCVHVHVFTYITLFSCFTGKTQARTVTKTVPNESFFSFFSPPDRKHICNHMY